MAEMEVRVPDARLWWSWDKGAQNLYSLEAGIGAEKGDWGDRRSVVFGIGPLRATPIWRTG
jgi:hypothetical protein